LTDFLLAKKGREERNRRVQVTTFKVIEDAEKGSK